MVVRDLEEVRRIFNTFDADQSGAIEPAEFLPLLSRLMRQPQSEMDKAVVWQCWESMDEDGSGQITFDEFEKWYCETFGCEPTDHTEDFSADLVPVEQKEIRQIAKKLGLDNVQTEELWKKFKALDEDNSGSLEFEEFKVLMNQKINPGKSKDDCTQVSEKMMKQFWADIDSDKSGAVTFSEFATWYVKMFMNGAGSDPLESYYDLVGRNHNAIVLDRMRGNKRASRAGPKAFWRDEADDGADKLE
jgi:Ca2+-binding EF-hand superfamily protein